MPGYRVTDEALIAETVVWPNFFLINVFFALKGSKLFIIISYHCGWMLCLVAAVKSLPALIYSADYILLMEYILRTRKLSYLKIHFLNKFEIFETTAVVKICKFTIFSSGSFCQIYRVTDEALIAETMVWPIFFLINVFFALKGSKLFIVITLSSNSTLSEDSPVEVVSTSDSIVSLSESSASPFPDFQISIAVSMSFNTDAKCPTGTLSLKVFDCLADDLVLCLATVVKAFVMYWVVSLSRDLSKWGSSF